MKRITVILTEDQAYQVAKYLTIRDISQDEYAFNWRIVKIINKALLSAKS